MPKILVADKISPAGVDILKDAGLEVDVNTGLSEDQLVGIAGEYEGIIVRSASTITGRIIKAALRLRLIGRAGVGVDNIDLEAATAAGVVVMNTPYGNITSAAEHSLALLLSLARHVPEASAKMKAGGWDKKQFTGVELTGKTLGVVGLGKVGSIVARAAQSLSMRVLVNDPFLNPERARELDVEPCDLEALLKRSDFITLHVPLSEATRSLVSTEQFAMMKPTARLINCARGGVVDEKALVAALAEGRIAGAAVDVFASEPLPADSPLRDAPNIILTPHLGASTTEAQEKVSEDLARQFVAFFAEGEIQNPVNLAVTLKPRLAPYANLAEMLGKFAAQIAPCAVERVECDCFGDIGKSADDAQVLAVFALQGVIGNTVDARVNLVNVGRIAESRGIALNVQHSEQSRMFQNIVVVRVLGDGGERSVTGTLFADNEPRIVRIDSFDIDLRPSEEMLMMAYPDRPGMVGKFGTILGEADVNIAGMSVGRREKRGKAVVVLTVDDAVNDDVLEKVTKAIDAEETHRIRL